MIGLFMLRFSRKQFVNYVRLRFTLLLYSLKQNISSQTSLALQSDSKACCGNSYQHWYLNIFSNGRSSIQQLTNFLSFFMFGFYLRRLSFLTLLISSFTKGKRYIYYRRLLFFFSRSCSRSILCVQCDCTCSSQHDENYFFS